MANSARLSRILADSSLKATRFPLYESMEVPMLTKIMKWSSIAALLVLAAVNWRSSPDYRTVLAALVVCGGAIVVLVQSASEGKYIWAAAFLAVSVLFNPALPISLPRNTFVMLDLVCLVLFAVSLAALKMTPGYRLRP
jgi:hypothetical protein